MQKISLTTWNFFPTGQMIEKQQTLKEFIKKILQVGEEETFLINYFKITAFHCLHHYAVKFSMQWLNCTTDLCMEYMRCFVSLFIWDLRCFFYLSEIWGVLLIYCVLVGRVESTVESRISVPSKSFQWFWDCAAWGKEPCLHHHALLLQSK